MTQTSLSPEIFHKFIEIFHRFILEQPLDGTLHLLFNPIRLELDFVCHKARPDLQFRSSL
jgi:hypothetical protein